MDAGPVRVDPVAPGRRAVSPGAEPRRPSTWPVALAIVLAAAILAWAQLRTDRYEGHPISDNGVWRIDRHTGEVVGCATTSVGAACFRFPPVEDMPGR